MRGNISKKLNLNNALGVNQEELNEIIDYYKLGDCVKKDELLKIMQELYNGYKFMKK